MVEKPEKTRPRLFLIDGYALIYRSFFAMISRPLTSSRGENTSAAWGVTKFLLRILEEHEPDYLGVVLDAGTSQRTERYPAYKATREKMPDELRASLPRIRELIEAFRIPVLELPGYEADDVIGTLAVRAARAGIEAVIVSGDKDFYQLLQDGVCLLNPGRGGPAGVEEEWVDLRNAADRLGVAPERVRDYLALIGDASDNVPGAKGIGPKTAIQLIEQFGPVEEILAHVGDVANKRAREALEQHRADVLLSKELVTIDTDLAVELNLDVLRVKEPDRERLRDVFLELEFHSLVRDYAAPKEAKRTLECAYTLVQAPEAVVELVDRIREQGFVSLDTETTNVDPMRAELVGLSLTLAPGESYYLPLAHRAPARLDLDGEAAPVVNLPPLDSLEMFPLVQMLEDDAVEKIGQNLKYDLLVLRRAGVELRGIAFDTMVASYVIEPGRREHNLDALALQYLDHRTTTYEELCGKGKDEIPFAEVPLERARDYCCEDSDVALRLEAIFRDELEKLGLMELYRTIEMPLLPVLADMEWAGIRIDPGFFAALAKKLTRELGLIQEEIYKVAGTEFNINSTPQLRQILFEKLGLPVLKRTKTGPSTDVSVLEELAAQGHALPRLLIEYRQLDKLKGTYVDALPLAVNPGTGRIHTSFSQTVAATGRLSSSDPNLQNIPIRTEIGAEIRKGFIPADGHVFLAADYSQIELRILAHLSGDPAFVTAFRNGEDIHRQTAAIVFDVPVEQVTPQMRNAAKTINFATIYGIGPFALAQRLGTSVADARKFIDQYFQRFPGVRRYLDEQIEHARVHGYVETLSGRRRYIPEIHARNFSVRQFGERAATNAPVQGTAADIIKIAMIDIHRELARRGAKTRMLLQVHDELVFEVPFAEVEEMRDLVKQRMEGAFALEVPLEVATGIGENWYECK
ncbi:MAG: DNA polymerase I [Gemmatimonadetes bacterium]|nr:DNA polymerase I [Gemmatimonadota bacterium]